MVSGPGISCAAPQRTMKRAAARARRVDNDFQHVGMVVFVQVRDERGVLRLRARHCVQSPPD